MKQIIKWMIKVNRETYDEALSLHARFRYTLKQKMGMQHKLDTWVLIK
jgi:hypothetical protein